jgi:hypothetical protein
VKEGHVQAAIAIAWGSHPRVRFARCNTGVGWFENGEPACRCPEHGHTGAYPVRFNPKGTADLVGVIAPTGRLLMIEVKGPKGTQSDDQKRMMRVVRAMGGVYVVARSVAEVDAVLIPLVGPR